MIVSMDAKPSIRHHFCALNITSVSTFFNFKFETHIYR